MVFGAVVAHLMPFERAMLLIDEVVFDVPDELTARRRAGGECRGILDAPGHLCGDADELRDLLAATLSAWMTSACW